MDTDEYDLISRKPLNLLSDKEKKGKSKKRLRDEHQAEAQKEVKVIITTTTKAEESFRSKQEEIAQKRILKKASKTHKQRVEEFNKHLDSLSEHYDIPKVSWTK